MCHRRITRLVLCTAATLAAASGLAQAQNILLNPGFDSVGGGSPGNRFADWTDFDNVAVNTDVARSAPNSVKAFGNFNGIPFNASGIFQEKPVTGGSGWKASIYVYNAAADAIQGQNFAAMNLIWFDASNNPISTESLRVAEVTTPTDQWIRRELVAAAPANAVKVQYILLHLQESTAGGSVSFDDAGLEPFVIPANQLLNPSFESLGGGSPGNRFANWVDFNNTFVQNLDPRTGQYAAKCFGTFSGEPFNASGLFQERPTTPGQQWTASVWVRNRSDDPIQGLNFAAMNIEWFNAANVQISFDSLNVADATTPVDTWLQRTATWTAPAGAVRARYVLLHLQELFAPGSVQFDDASLTTVTAQCYANCDGSTAAPTLNALDFACFLNRYRAGEEYANCDGSTAAPTLNALDFSCFLNAFRAGCP